MMPLAESSLVALQASHDADDLHARVRRWMHDSDRKCKRKVTLCFHTSRQAWNNYDDLSFIENDFLLSEWFPKRKSEYDSFESCI